MKDIRLFISQPVAKFYDSLFLNLDLSFVTQFPKTRRKGFSNHAMICAFIVMKCEGFSIITDLVDYLNNNLLITYYCGFHISVPLPSYWTFDRFLKIFPHETLSNIMKSQVRALADKGIVDTLFIGLDSTPVAANTSDSSVALDILTDIHSFLEHYYKSGHIYALQENLLSPLFIAHIKSDFF